jgi:hypothetical protein
MFRRRFSSWTRRSTLAFCRAFAVVAIAAKLVVPVGYMPASLADGGPIMLCGSGLPDGFGAHDGHDATMHGAPVPGTADEPASDHPEWERCSLGGLAGLAALGSEWRIDFLAGAPERAEPLDSLFLPRSEIVAFRPRAPPIALT